MFFSLGFAHGSLLTLFSQTKQIPFMGVIGFFGQFLLFGGFAIAFYAGGRFVDGNHCS
jgi:hypothetical protein